MLTNQLLSVLSCQRFLTLREICRATNLALQSGENQLKILENQNLIEHRFFAGRNYFKLSRSISPISDLGKRTWEKLTHRKSVIRIGQARTCYHHLAGQAGVQLFQLLIQAKLVRYESPAKYVLSEAGKHRFSRYLGEPVRQSQIQTCIDFSERLPHLSGVLGTKMLDQLVADKVVTLESNRQVVLNLPLKRWFKEKFLEDKPY
ncbi:transcriptional regulator [Lentilactobacillus raoultii]|uniref:Transcriptional regulator n=1 Tax=Lentilactobacillus raoultii TaxID=1987503 RepID=A0ABW3PJH9_9LACO|nr:transcriptional regulator [Lentilactobacillus raoultii]